MKKGDQKDMQFFTHIFKKHKIPTALIATSVLMLVVHFMSTSFAVGGPFAPGDELDPSCEPGDAGCIVEFTGSQWDDVPAGIYGTSANTWPESVNFTGDVIIGPHPNTQIQGDWDADNPMAAGSTSGVLYLYGSSSGGGGGRIFFGDIGSEWTNPYIGERWTRTDTVQPSDSDKLDISAKSGIYFLTGGGNTVNAAGLLARDRMVIDSTGNVGVGTTSPSQKFHVLGNTRLEGDVTITGTCTGCGGSSGWTDNGTTVSLTTTSDNVKMNPGQRIFAENGTVASKTAFIEWAGNPDDGKFITIGSKDSSSSLLSNLVFDTSSTTDPASKWTLETAAGGEETSILATKSSYLVKGNASGFQGLEYNADYSANNTTNNRWLVDKGYVDSVAGGWGLSGNAISSGQFIGTTNGQDLVFKANNAEKMRIKGSGGIDGIQVFGGTVSTPGNYMLAFGPATEVYGTSSFALGDTIQIWDNNTFVYGTGITTNSANIVAFDIGSSAFSANQANTFVIKGGSAGKVGIGTESPSYKLDVQAESGGDGDINVDGVYRVDGTGGVTTSFSTASTCTITVTGGIITNVACT